MAKSEAKRIIAQIDKEFERFHARVNPKLHRRTKGRLHRLKRILNRIKPLKVKAHYVSVAERDARAKINHVKGQISWAKRKTASDKARIVALHREMQKLRHEIPQLNKNVRSWSSAERNWTRKHISISREWGNLQRRISREEKRKAKVIKSLQKFFK